MTEQVISFAIVTLAAIGYYYMYRWVQSNRDNWQ